MSSRFFFYFHFKNWKNKLKLLPLSVQEKVNHGHLCCLSLTHASYRDRKHVFPNAFFNFPSKWLYEVQGFLGTSTVTYSHCECNRKSTVWVLQKVAQSKTTRIFQHAKHYLQIFQVAWVCQQRHKTGSCWSWSHRRRYLMHMWRLPRPRL